MKAQELRIGNWVYWDDKTMRSKVNGIHPSGKYAHLENTWIDLFRCDPIPLTEEWLLKFGFVKAELEFYKKPIPSAINAFICINIKLNSYQIIQNELGFNIQTQKVHQLQNLYFALTGQELTLK